MELTASDVVAFINADCVPLSDIALAELVAPLAAPGGAAATYARQVPRTDADPLVRLEYARVFSPTAAPRIRHGAFFSMAASAIRRDAWNVLPFDETLRYSEDVDWSHRIRALGGAVRYVPDARFEHSHNYDWRGQFTRRRGEGKADALIHRLGAPSVLRDLVKPLGGALLRDARARLLSAESVLTRGAQALGYFEGRREATHEDRRAA
jgi:rhamnosyltransferase